ncbi:uncharacterized protein N7443_007190 [Penicillium atrosanguineum]|uniref:uncharacterized protein n=1 Tax=Penicillium atrosanguineum TaxID=1132637 RepID=UPI0023825EB2|nr:uncharacterized protein N7443_007190 [Penicillium atrosanguineum]KAJ5296297.1 hypothetical protein N7443_007190 [Penicillium atrosanguineum]
MKALIGLDFVAVGGGAIKPALGELLVSSGVKLLNHYGATEIGAIAPIFVPGEDYDWNYLRIRTDMGLEINEVEKVDENGDPLYQLVGYPFGWGSPFVVQDLLRRRPGSAHTEVAILGRNDDLLVLSTGEKILPNQLETRLCRREGVKTVLVFGQDREEVGVLIEPEEHLRNTEVEHFVERMWSVLLEENNSLDRHARIASKGMILIKDADRAWPRTDKGSIMRRETYNLFCEEIAEAYAASGPSDSFSFSLGSNLDEIISNLRAMVQSCVQDRDISVADWADSDDWFELGMDSLEATRLARMLNHVSDKDSFPALTRQKLQPAFIYQHPNFKVLSEYLLADTSGEETNGHSSHSAIDQMIDLVSKYTPARSSGWVILLTGATGHLGAHLLEQLSCNSNVSQVICLSRLRQQQDPQYRQQQANNRHRITLSEAAWAKVRFLTSSQLHQPDLGLPHKEYRRLVQTVTHIVHNAWPMDFQRGLSSFEAQIQAVRRLVILCEDCQKKPRCLPSPRLLFTSSIAVGARNSSGRLPEEPISDPSTTANLGYAQAKWVCEQIIIDAAKTRSDLLHPSILRLGQLTGGMISGIWNSNEHFPALLKASQIIGCLPELNGVSNICVNFE